MLRRRVLTLACAAGVAASTSVALAGTATAGLLVTAQGRIDVVPGVTLLPAAGQSSVDLRYRCSPTPYAVQISVAASAPGIRQANNWARFGYPFLSATCDGHDHTATARLSSSPWDHGEQPPSFVLGQAVTVGVDLVQYEHVDWGERWVAEIAGDQRTEYAGGVPARCLPADGLVTPVAGTGSPGTFGREGDGGTACDAPLAYPTSVATAGDGTTYVADYLNSTVRRLDPDGTISAVAGTGTPGYGGDGGPATAAQLDRPRAIALDTHGDLLVADTVNNRVRRLDHTTGRISTLAGTGTWGSYGTGASALRAQLAGPHGLAVSADGSVWIADTGNRRVVRVDPAGRLWEVGGLDLVAPRSLAVDATALYVSDPGRSAVLRLDLRTGRQTTLVPGISNPASLLVRGGSLLVTVAGADRVIAVDLATGRVGAGVGGGSGDLPTGADRVGLLQPQGLASLPDGSVLVADTGHHRLLRWRP